MYRTSGGTTVKLPCFGELFGSCDYGNVCDLLSAITECPDPFIQYNIPCKCPVPKVCVCMFWNSCFGLGEASYNKAVTLCESQKGKQSISMIIFHFE